MSPLLHHALRFCLGRLGRVEIINFPNGYSTQRGAVIVCNHVGWADSFWIGYAFYPTQLHYMAKEGLFHDRVSSWAMRALGAFPVERESPSRHSIQTAVHLLKSGRIVVMFPGGTRSQHEVTFKRGAATIAAQADVDLLPVHYHGPRTIRFAHLVRRPQIRLIFGAPISTGRDASKPASKKLTQQLQNAIHEMQSSQDVTVS